MTTRLSALFVFIVPVGLLLAVCCGAGPAGAYEQHFNCGGSGYTASTGTVYDADRAYVAGDAGYVGGWTPADPSWQPIGGTPDPVLYERVRISATGYQFDVPSGSYLVTLGMTDNYEHSTDENRFDIKLEGVTEFPALDIYERTGRTYAFDLKAEVFVSDGTLAVDFLPLWGDAKIAAIGVVSRDPDVVAPATPTGVQAFDSYGSVMIEWDSGTEDDLAGYQLERSSAAGGPFSPIMGPGNDIDRVPWHIDAGNVGETWYYRVAAVDVYGNASPPSVVVSGTVLAHSASALPLVDVQIDPFNLEVLNNNPSLDDLHPLSVLFDGSVLVPGEGRYRGNVARSLPKKSWKLKLSGLYDDRDNFNMNAEYIDRSLLRERLAYELLARSGALTPKARFVHLSVNDDWHGVYLDVENVNTHFLDRLGLESGQATMYKAGDNLGTLANPQMYMDRYEKELGDPLDYSDLITFIEELNTTPSDQMFNWLAAHIDFPSFFSFYSAEVILQNNDIGFKNFYLHHDLTTDKWTVIPWDVDLTFGYIWPFDETWVHNSSAFIGSVNKLFLKVLTVPMWKQLHYDQMREIMAHTFNTTVMNGMVDDYHNEIAYDAVRDWFKWGRNDNSHFQEDDEQIKDFVVNRTSYLNLQITGGENPSDLIINEIAASNGTVIADEWGEFDDYVELYNRGTQPVSTNGLYFTDELTLPGRMALPDTTLNPGEYVLVWCDGDSLQGPWHAPFQLDVKGESVGIFEGPLVTSAPIDVKVYGGQYTDATYGRLPNGGPVWELMPTPTPLGVNTGGGNLIPQFRDRLEFPQAPAEGAPVQITARIFDDVAVLNPELYYNLGQGYVSVPMLDDGMSGDGAPGDGVYGATIPGQAAGITAEYYLRAEDNLGAVALDPPTAPAGTHMVGWGYVAPLVTINEFQALNNTTIADEFGEFEDWIEVYNLSGDDLDLGGMYLTDNFSNPTKFTFPSMVVPSGGYVLVWCDGEPAEGPLHAPFRLSSSGEEIGLFAPTQFGFGLVDSTTFGVQIADETTGRIPNGFGDFVVTPLPTPGATNTPQIGVGPVGAVPRVLRLSSPFPNPFRPSTRVQLDLPEVAAVQVAVFDVQGRRVRTLAEGQLQAGRHVLQWDGRVDGGGSAASGVYWIRLDAPGEARSVRAVLLR